MALTFTADFELMDAVQKLLEVGMQPVVVIEKRQMSLAEQVRAAQREVASWPAEKCANVQLEGAKGGITE